MPTRQSIRTNISTLRQIVELIPGHLVNNLSKKHGVNKQSRKYTPWSHVLSLMFAQLAHSLSLNDICDSLRNHEKELKTIRAAVPPSRNGLSNANRNRNADMAEELFWTVLEHLQNSAPGFGGKNYTGMPKRFKRLIHVVDSTTISLVANCLDWAKHRRRKAAAKCHMRLDLQSFLPKFAIVDSAKCTDPVMAYELCADIKGGEIVVFDKAYVDFKHLFQLNNRGVFWVTRAKDNMQYKTVKKNEAKGNILRDEIIELTVPNTFKLFPVHLRLVEASVEVNGKEIEMTFITNNFKWAASSICDLYKSRWSIEVFFKQLKQNLQLGDFLGHSKNAVRWQIWMALLTYVLLRFIAFSNKWNHSFRRLFTLLRGVLWSKFNILAIMDSYGTAEGQKRMRAAPEQAYLPGFSKKLYGTAHG
jgi:hypothetical protein